MLDLNDLRVFEQVATLRSFSAAARALAQPKSNISRSIARLEVKLGARLFQRTTREVVLTSAGERLIARCSAALGQLRDVTEDTSGIANEPRGELKLAWGSDSGSTCSVNRCRHSSVDIL